MKKIACLLIIILLNSCANLTSLQDGKTLAKGEIEVTPIASVGTLKNNFANSINENEDKKEYFPSFGCRIKYGFSEKFDAGIQIDLSTNVGLTTKYQFIGNKFSKFNSSMGLDFGVNFFRIGYNEVIYYYSVPIYLSYHPNKSFCFTLTPRWMNNSKYVTSEEYSKETVGEKYNSNRFIISYGFLFGKKDKFGLELSNVSNNIFRPIQISVGYSVKI